MQPNKLLQAPKHGSVGPIVAILLILTLLIFGALYFLNLHFVNEAKARSAIPYIPSGTTTVIIQQ
jgi:hypothetical protein